jgi:hypothetical protein
MPLSLSLNTPVIDDTVDSIDCIAKSIACITYAGKDSS